MKITGLKEQDNRVTVYLSGLKEPLTVSIQTAVEHKLVNGIVLTESQVAILQEESELFRCEQKAARMMAMRGHSIGEFKRKLYQKEFSKKVVETVVGKYLQQGILDDAQYALQIGQSLVERKPCGKPFLVSHLQQKLIDRKTAEEAAAMILSGTDDTVRAVAALQKKWLQYRDLALEEARTKAYNYLSRRGFAYEAAKTAFEQVQKDNSED